jgi:hypothetical protein
MLDLVRCVARPSQQTVEIGGDRRHVAARAAGPTAPVIKALPLNPNPNRRMRRPSVSGRNWPSPSTSTVTGTSKRRAKTPYSLPSCPLVR